MDGGGGGSLKNKKGPQGSSRAQNPDPGPEPAAFLALRLEVDMLSKLARVDDHTNPTFGLFPFA